MAQMAPFAESDFDSIHSSQAFVRDHQVMYTPPLRAKKASRFASTQSYILPDIPNTSQIVGAGAGELPKMRPSGNENQIVNALVRLQKQLDQAKATIRELMHERDEYRGEAKMLRQILAQTPRSMGHKAETNKAGEELDNDLLDFTQYSDVDDDLTRQLPTLNVVKAKSNLKASSEQAPHPQQRPQEQAVPNEAPTPRAIHRHSARAQQNQSLGPQRQPLREISERQYQHRSQTSPQRTGKKVMIEEEHTRDTYQNNTAQTNAQAPTRNFTYLSNIPDNQPFTALRNQLEAERLNRQRSAAKDTGHSRQDTARSMRAATAPPLAHEPITIPEDKELTAASNTSRRRRRASDTADIDDGMTSAYLLPDITIAKPEVQAHAGDSPQPSVKAAPSPAQPKPGLLSEEAKNFLHSVDPDHIVTCAHCKRLLRLPEKMQAWKEAGGWDWYMMVRDQ